MCPTILKSQIFHQSNELSAFEGLMTLIYWINILDR